MVYKNHDKSEKKKQKLTGESQGSQKVYLEKLKRFEIK